MVDPTNSLLIQQELVDDAQAPAKELNVSWSRVVTLALREFVHISALNQCFLYACRN